MRNMTPIFRYLLLLFAGLLPFTLAAQKPTFTQEKIAPREGLRVTVSEKGTGVSIPFAKVVLLSLPDSVRLAARMADESGKLLVEWNESYSQYPRFFLKITAIGYQNLNTEPISQAVFAGSLAKEWRLAPNIVTTEEVQIEGRKQFAKVEVDKKVYQVEQLTIANGGSVSDVLNQLPSVQVDLDGAVSLRGQSNLLILIDGKPSGITAGTNALDQIPASTIERIEVITSPGAKYDPDGAAGIINIITKKVNVRGASGSLQAGIGNHDKYNTAITYQYRIGSWSFLTNYGYRHQTRWFKGQFDRRLFRPDTFGQTTQNGGLNTTDNNNARFSAEYQASPSSKFTASANWSYGKTFRYETNPYRYPLGLPTEPSDLLSQRNTYNPQANRAWDFRTGYTKTGEKGQTLDLAAVYSPSIGVNANNFQNLFAFPQADTLPFQRNRNSSFANITTLSADYLIPGKNNFITGQPEGKQEMGIKAIIRNVGSLFTAENQRTQDADFVFDPRRSNDFAYVEQIFSAYYSRQGKIHWNGINYSAGLRLEHSNTDIIQRTTQERFNRPLTNLFPSFSVSKSFYSQTISFNANRRIDRPTPGDLNPFPDVADPYNVYRGNPYLKPEYNWSFDLGHDWNYKSISLTSSLYFRRAQNQKVRFVSTDTNRVATITVSNIAQVHRYGAESILRWDAGRWSSTASVNVFQNNLNGLAGNQVIDNGKLSMTGRLLGNYKLAKTKTDIQVAYAVRSPLATPQGQLGWFQNVDIAVRQEINSQCNLALSVLDVFNQLQFNFQSAGPDFALIGFRKRETRYATLTLTWKWGRLKEERKKGDDSRPMLEEM